MSEVSEIQREDPPQHPEPAAPPEEPSAGIPRWLIFGSVGVIGFAALVGILLLVVSRIGGGGSTPLNTNNPSTYHPDGITVSLAPGVERARVGIETTPREAFVNNTAGKEWAAALEAFPAGVQPLSPIYSINAKQDEVIAEMAIPNGAEPLYRVDLYHWNEDTQSWVFLPSQTSPTSQGILFEPLDGQTNVIAVLSPTTTPAVGVVVSPGSQDLGGDFGLGMPEGMRIDAAGNFVNEAPSAASTVKMPIFQNREGGLADYASADVNTPPIQQAVAVTATTNGLVLDFAPGEGYEDFVMQLADALHEQGKQLEIIIRDTDLTLVDLAAVADKVDRVWIAPGDNPTIYAPGGDVRLILASAVGNVDRRKLGLLVNGLTVDITASATETLSFEEATSRFGDVAAVAGYLQENQPIVQEGGSIPFAFRGRVESLGYAEALGMNFITYRDDDTTLHYVYFGSAQGLLQKLNWAREYGFGAVAVKGIAHPDAPDRLADGLTGFLVGQPIGSPEGLELVWRVEDESGAAIAESRGGSGLLQYLWEAAVEPGKYFIRALVSGDAREIARGEVAVDVVAELPEDVEEVEAEETPTPTPTTQAQQTDESDDGSEDEEPEATPEPTSPPVSGSAGGGSFELGGQTHTLGNPGAMYDAGMTWVKFQQKWTPGASPYDVAGRIDNAHNYGFKVLLSIPGELNPSSINFQSYIEYLRVVATLKPDAIEVWNEMNLTREWPAGQIDGANYVSNMLAPAYEAIKGQSPGTMVIAGAPAPTGAFGGGCGGAGCDDLLYIQQMAAAGAGSYSDCIGIHYNEGILPPSQTSGDPRGSGEFYTRYFWGMVNTYYDVFQKQLCFTELGYLTADGYANLPAAFAWAGDTSVQEQAQWLAEAAVLSAESGKVRLLIVFNVDFTTYGEDPQAGYAMIRPGGGCPACQTLGQVMGVSN